MSCAYHMCVPDAHGGQRWAFNPLELDNNELFDERTGNPSQLFHKSISAVNTKTTLQPRFCILFKSPGICACSEFMPRFLFGKFRVSTVSGSPV